MKRMALWIALIAAVGLVAGTVQAQCCKKGDKAEKADKAMCRSGGCPMTTACEKLNLTDEQKAKVEALKAEIMKDMQEKCMKGMESILTPEQFAQFKEACEKSCPMKKECTKKADETAKEPATETK